VAAAVIAVGEEDARRASGVFCGAVRPMLLALLALCCGTAAGGGATAAAAADAADLSIDRLATGRAVPGPAGWLNYCMRDLARCQQASAATRVPATPETLALLARVQRDVNAQVRPREEPSGQDLWRVAPVEGDCEDFALTKQQLLRAAGLPASAVRLAVVRTLAGEEHAVLTVETSAGTLLLDNLRPAVVPFGTAGFRWLMLEQPGPRLRWQELRNDPTRVALQLPLAAAPTRRADHATSVVAATGQ
jgi:predicted transglutaminase-like cysteine proteinase